MFDENDHTYMRAAMEEANKAAERDEVPVGAVLVDRTTKEIIARNGNRTIKLNDPTAHAEILVIREACKKIGAQRIPDFDLYVTLEPCTMCTAAIAFARIPRLVIGALDEKGGGVINGVKFYDQPTCHHKIDVSHGLLADESSALLKSYFQSKRA
ncbi:MAG: nucleoside deaminase [Pseudomonadota bacterium]